MSARVHSSNTQISPSPYEDAAVRRALQSALAEVYSGAGFAEADALLDHLGDLGYQVERAGDAS